MTELTSPTKPAAPTTSTPQVTSKSITRAARDITKACWAIGLALLLFGGIIAGASLPSLDPFSGDSGSQGGLLFRLATVGVGQLAVLVAIISTGVRLGVDSASRNQAA